MSIPNPEKKLYAMLITRYEPGEARIIASMASDAIQEHQGNKEELFHTYFKELQEGKPIQYVTGKCYFSDFELKVSEAVLIPRPETDELVHWILTDISGKKAASLRVLDIGTGSGCIPIAIAKKFPEAEVYATDISPEALNIARENAARIKVSVDFIEDDILQTALTFKKNIDLIISNPPYIGPDEKDNMEEHVVGYEPHSALFVTDNDPLQFYKAIETVAQRFLTEDGSLYFEVHSLYAAETENYFRSKGWNTILKKDMQGKERMLKCKRLLT